VVDSASPVARSAAGSQIYVSGSVGGNNAIVQISSASFDQASTVINTTQTWITTESMGFMATDDKTGDLWGLSTNQNIYRLWPNGTSSLVISVADLSALYCSGAGLGLFTIRPRSLAFDSNSNMFVALDSNNGHNPMLLVLQPALDPLQSVVVPLNNSWYYSTGPYGRAFQPSESVNFVSLNFANGYLYAMDTSLGFVVRTQLPYSLFTNQDDLANNSLVAMLKGSWNTETTGQAIHPATGTFFVQYSTSRQFVQYRSVGGQPQFSPFESPCLGGDAFSRVIGYSSRQSTSMGVDGRLPSPRLYVFPSSGDSISWFNVSFDAPLPQAAAGCLSAAEVNSFTVPVTVAQAPIPFAIEPNYTRSFYLEDSLNLTIGSINAMGAGPRGVMFVAGTNAVTLENQVVSFQPQQSANGSDVTPTFVWTLGLAKSCQTLVFNGATHQLYCFSSSGDILRFDNSSSTTSVFLSRADIQLPGPFAFDPQGSLWAVGPSGDIVAVQSGANGTRTITHMDSSTSYTNAEFGANVSPTWSQLMFAHGYLYLLDTSDGAVVRTLYPYSFFTNASDFVANPLVSVVLADWETQFDAMTIDVETSTLFLNAIGYYEDNPSGRVSIVQFQRIGQATYLNFPWSVPCLPDAVSTVAQTRAAHSINSAASMAIDSTISPARLYVLDQDITSGQPTITYTHVAMRPALSQSAMSCLSPSAPLSSSSSSSSTGQALSSTGGISSSTTVEKVSSSSSSGSVSMDSTGSSSGIDGNFSSTAVAPCLVDARLTSFLFLFLVAATLLL